MGVFAFLRMYSTTRHTHQGPASTMSSTIRIVCHAYQKAPASQCNKGSLLSLTSTSVTAGGSLCAVTVTVCQQTIVHVSVQLQVQ